MVILKIGLRAGVSILQENLNYSPALCAVYKILPQILPQLQKLQVHFNQGCRSVFDMISSQLGPKPTRPKPSRPKTNSAQNQVGPKPSRPKPNSALPWITRSFSSLLLFPLFSFFLFLLLSSFVLCPGNLFPLKKCHDPKILEIWNTVGLIFKLYVTVMWIKVYCLEWEWVRESIFGIREY